MAKRVRRSNVKDGVLLPLGNGFSLVKGDHPNKVDDVDIGPNNKNGLSVNHGEILQQKGNTLRVFSAEPMLGGISPVQLLYGGMAPDKVFAMQEQYKRTNRIADDGTKYQGGGKINRNKQTFDTILNDEQEVAFKDWYKNISSKLNINSNPDDYNHGYDYRGYWLENKDNDIDYSAKDFHFPDKYKKPNHETFSNESIYANKKYGIDPKTVGYWKNDVFVPGSFNNLINNSHKNLLEKEGFYYKNDEQLSLRQRYAESTFNDKALNRWSKAAGAYQIMPHIHKAYVKATGHKGDLYDLEYNTAIRNWLMDDINKNAHIKDSRNSNRNRLIKTYAAYNWGSGNLGTFLRRLEKEGVDTFNSYDWVNRLPKETKDYVNFIIHGDNINDIKNNEKYKEALDSLRTKKEFGGRKKFQDGGKNKGNGFKIVKQRTDFQPTKFKTFLRRLYASDNSDSAANRYGDFSRMYFGMPLTNGLLYESNYKPTMAKNPNAKYYGVTDVKFINDVIELYNHPGFLEKPHTGVVNGYYTRGTKKYPWQGEYLSDDLMRDIHNNKKIKMGRTPLTLGPGALGNFTIGRGKDENGEYLSYYDLWDVNPKRSHKAEERGFAKAYEIYDRIYGTFNENGVFTPNGTIQPSVITADKKQFGGQTNINPLGERPNAKYGKEMKNKRTKAVAGKPQFRINNLPTFNFTTPNTFNLNKPFYPTYVDGPLVGSRVPQIKLDIPAFSTTFTPKFKADQIDPFMGNKPAFGTLTTKTNPIGDSTTKTNPVENSTKSNGLSTTAMGAIGAGINTLGSLIGAGIQQYAINNLKAPQRQYTLLSPVKLKTKININPQIARMREMQAQIADAARRTSGSSRTAYQKILAGHNRLLDSTKKI